MNKKTIKRLGLDKKTNLGGLKVYQVFAICILLPISPFIHPFLFFILLFLLLVLLWI